jgi:MoxR-like ATPase/Mg-chelatase subunit ChlD
MDVQCLFYQVAGRVVGRKREIRLVLAALARLKPILLLGLPGVSKTTILKEVVAALSADHSSQLFTVTGDEQLTAFSLAGSFDPALVLRDGFKPEYFTPGPLVRAMESGGVLYVEELNRAPGGALNVLMTCLSDGYLDVPRYGRVQARPGFTVVGACNPLDDIGTGRLSRGLADRFVILELGYQPRDEELEIVLRRAGGRCDSLIPFAVDVARATRSHPDLRYGASVRGAIDFVHLLEGIGPEALDEEVFHLVGCSAYAGKVRVKPTVSRPACEIVVELMKSLLERDYGGDLERLRLAPSPWGTPQEIGEDEPAGDQEGSERQGGRRAARARGEPDELPGLAKAGGGEEAGRSRAVPMVERDSGLPPTAGKIGDLGEERAEALAQVAEVRRRAAQLVLRKAGEVWDGRGQRANRSLVSEPWWQALGGELDLDGSLEGYLRTGGRVQPGDLRLFARAREASHYLILVDHSGSMVGRKLLLAAVLASVLAQLTAQGRGDFAVLAFDDKLAQLKGFGEECDLEALIETILRLPEGRATDLSQAFAKAAELLAERAEPTDCVLISDCMPTRGDATYEGLRRLVEGIPSLYIAYVEDRGAALELFGSESRQRFDLYEWWARRWVGDDQFQRLREADDIGELVDRLSGLGPGDRL